MVSLSRRNFLGASVAGLSAALASQGGVILSSATGQSGNASDTDTLFLTWQRDPCTTMTIQWVAPLRGSEDTRIHWAPATKSEAEYQVVQSSVRHYPMTELMIYRAELTGLTPQTDYQFRVGTQARTFRFRTMPSRANDTIHFISGGDCGTNSHAIANNIQAARQDPMFALIGGDLAYENGQSPQTHLAFLRNYSRHMVGLNDRLIPMIACIGNHEVNGSASKASWERAPFFFALFDGLFRETSYATLDFGDYLSLVLLDTGHTAPVAGEQSHWLEQRLKERLDCPHVLVVNHVPAYPSARDMNGPNGTGGTGDANRKHWVPLFEKYRVPVVLEHHDHTFKRTKPLLGGLTDSNGVLYLGDGSWGQIRALNKPEKLSHLALARQDYHLSLHRLEGKERFHLALAENGRVMDVCETAQRRQGLIKASL